jgi:hypothetical protein
VRMDVRGHLDESFLLTCLHMYVWTPMAAVRRGSSPLGLNAPRTPRGRSCYMAAGQHRCFVCRTGVLPMGARVSAATACILHRAGRLSQRSVVPGGTRAPLPFLFNQAANFRSLGSLGAYGFRRGLPSSPSSCRTFSNLVAGLSAAPNPSLCGLSDIPNTEWHQPASD